MRYILQIALLVFLFSNIAYAQGKYQFKSYNQLDSLAQDLANNNRFEEAIEILKKAETLFPDSILRQINLMALFYLLSGQNEKAMDVYEYGHSKGLFFRLLPTYEAYIRLYNNVYFSRRFRDFLDEDIRRFKEAEESAKMEYDVVLPSNYDKTKKYPVFIPMHGYGSNASVMKRNWRLDKYRDQVILVYLQSSQLVGMNIFGWVDIRKARNDLSNLYDELKDNYNINDSLIIVGGISQGGEVALDAVLNDVIPIKGFVALIPAGGMMEGLNLSNVKSAVSRNVAGQIIAGENDESFARQKGIAALFEQGGLRSQFIVIPKIGHRLPSNLNEKLDNAINYIIGN